MLSKKVLAKIKKQWHPEIVELWIWSQEQYKKDVKRRTKKRNK